MYLPEALPIPWRALEVLERAGLHALPWQRQLHDLRRPGREPVLRLLALGDIALTPAAQVDPSRAFSGIAHLLQSVDLRTANLEAQLTSATARASVVGSGIRAEPAMVDALRAAHFDVLTVANNHALDFGNAALAESVGRLADGGIRACGIGTAPTIVQARGQRVAFLGFCDDHFNGPNVQESPRPALATLTAVDAAVRDARSAGDLVVVHLHWGYEFALHPLLAQRDFARKVIDSGASLVLCHHAHVPLGFELHGDGAIAYGLGNGLMALSPYLRAGHAWTDRSIALEFGFDPSGVCAVIAHPIRLQRDGKVAVLDDPSECRALRAGLLRMNERLGQTNALQRLETVRSVVEALRIPAALREAVATSRRAVRERLGAFALPRQARLAEFLSEIEPLREIAAVLRSLQGASPDGPQWEDFPVGLLTEAFEQGRPLLMAKYRWTDALRARLP